MSSYIPDPIGTPKSFEELVEYMQREYQRISTALERGLGGQLEEHFREPVGKTENLMVIADGVNWNPTEEGRGVYIWTGGQWNLVKALPPRADDPTPTPTENTAPENTDPTPPFESPEDPDPPILPTIVSLEPATISVDAGSTIDATVTISAIQASPTTIALTNNDPAKVSMPTSVVVVAGQTTAVFQVQGLAEGVVTVTAGLNGTSDTSEVTIRPVEVPEPDPDPGGGGEGEWQLPSDIATAVPTFHSMSLYWSPPSGSTITGEVVHVEYKKSSEADDPANWKKGFPLWYDSTDRQARGSIVYLDSGTSYDFRLGVVDGVWTAGARRATWTEKLDGTFGGADFPTGTVTQLGNVSTTFSPQAGTPTAWRVYENGTIDVANNSLFCMILSVPYILFRNIVFKGAQRHLVSLRTGTHHIVFEHCDFTQWGSKNQQLTDRRMVQSRVVNGTTVFGPYHNQTLGYDIGNQDACLHAFDQHNIDFLVLQYCKFHDPRFGSNPWDIGHPIGPSVLYTDESSGKQWVFRYNEVFSARTHLTPDTNDVTTFDKYLQDVFIGDNFSATTGCPADDSDVYGNFIQGVMDDGFECEGREVNVRVWNNFLDNISIGLASTQVSRGPIYFWRNVTYRSRFLFKRRAWTAGDQSSDNDDRGNFGKCASVTADCRNRGGGRRYFFHNTILQPPPRGIPGEVVSPIGLAGGISGLSPNPDPQPLQNTYSRNNIYQMWKSHWGVFSAQGGTNNSSDYDMSSGNLGMPSPNVVGANIMTQTAPTFKPGHGNAGVPTRSNPQGLFQLEVASPGLDDGQELFNFNKDFSGGTYFGTAPDRGAHESGSRPFIYGVTGRGNGKPIAA